MCCDSLTVMTELSVENMTKKYGILVLISLIMFCVKIKPYFMLLLRR